MPTIYIIAGCNGAGKTTAAYSLLPDVFKTLEFINADEIARGLSPFNIEGVAFQAGRIMLERLDYLIAHKKDFAFETTLSGFSYLKLIEVAKSKSYQIVLFFVWLNSIELAKERVAIRVAKGGHNIPDATIERRYSKGIRNFSTYATKADEWYIYNNSKHYDLIAKSIKGEQEIFNFEVFNKISQP
jgi:predicted ABC-type ATPase